MPSTNFKHVIARRREDHEEPLGNHVGEVSERMVNLGHFSDAPSSGISDASIARCIGILHDFGKVAPAFQRHVRDWDTGGPKKYTYHARLGAFAAFHALEQMGVDETEQLVGWAAILRHHGKLPDLARRTFDAASAEYIGGTDSWAVIQWKQIKEREQCRSIADMLLRTATAGAATWETFSQAIEDKSLFTSLEDLTGEYNIADPELLPQGLYDRLVRLWSALTLADKTASGAIPMSKLQGTALELSKLEQHIHQKQESSHDNPTEAIAKAEAGVVDPTDEASLNALREAARLRVRSNAHRIADSEIGLLTLPTGLGKTFTGITGALKLRDELKDRRNLEEAPTVVYALPYTSIIEQTRELFEDESIFGADPLSSAFTVHHYLSETATYHDSEGEAKKGKANIDHGPSAAELLAESWRSGVVLTTFVQLFESLTGPSNSQGLKLPALHNAVIVLDEPQALPAGWWEAIRRLCRLLIEQFDAKIISMTATQPTLFTEGDFNTTTLLDADKDDVLDAEAFEERAYKSTARVRYRLDPSIGVFDATSNAVPITHKAAGERLAESALATTECGGDSILAVCNTIASSRQLTETAAESLKQQDLAVTHLGSVCQRALEEIDTDESVLPNVGEVTDRVLEKLDLACLEHEQKASSKAYVGTLNARYRPIDRHILIAVAEELSTAGVPFVFVSTQAIEAGVDISFTRAYRDIAPLDSIVQVAGRCNRSFEWGREGGTVTIWTLAEISEEGDIDPENGTPPAKYIYEPSRLSDVAEILLSQPKDADGSVAAVELERNAVPEYFEAVEESGAFRTDIVDDIAQTKAEELSGYSLIDDSYQTCDVLVAVTAADQRRLDSLVEAFNQYDGAGFQRLSELTDLRLSVPVENDASFLQTHIRADLRNRTNTDGTNVLVHRGGEGGAEYVLDDGGFIAADDDGLSGRFTLS